MYVCILYILSVWTLQKLNKTIKIPLYANESRQCIFFANEAWIILLLVFWSRSSLSEICCFSLAIRIYVRICMYLELMAVFSGFIYLWIHVQNDSILYEYVTMMGEINASKTWSNPIWEIAKNWISSVEYPRTPWNK